MNFYCPSSPVYSDVDENPMIDLTDDTPELFNEFFPVPPLEPLPLLNPVPQETLFTTDDETDEESYNTDTDDDLCDNFFPEEFLDRLTDDIEYYEQTLTYLRAPGGQAYFQDLANVTQEHVDALYTTRHVFRNVGPHEFRQ